MNIIDSLTKNTQLTPDATERLLMLELLRNDAPRPGPAKPDPEPAKPAPERRVGPGDYAEVAAGEIPFVDLKPGMQVYVLAHCWDHEARRPVLNVVNPVTGCYYVVPPDRLKPL